MLSIENVDMNARQCRAARALIDWTQPQLAEASGVSLSTVVDFEKERRAVSVDAQDKITAALQKAGIAFIEKNGGGPGVRLVNSEQAK